MMVSLLVIYAAICRVLSHKCISQKDLLEFAKAEWQWIETTVDREAKVQADQLVERIKNLIAETQDNPKLNQLIKEKLADVVES